MADTLSLPGNLDPADLSVQVLSALFGEGWHNLASLAANFKLSISERTRSLMDPRLPTSSIFSSVRVFPWRFSRLRISSVRNASGPHPNEVICMNCTFRSWRPAQSAALRMRFV